MSNQTDNLNQLLMPFGLSLEEAVIYLHMAQKGFLSALAISRDLHIGRTKVYRILDKLIDKQLVEQKLDDMGMKFGAVDPVKLEQLVIEKEHEVAGLRESLSVVVDRLKDIFPRPSQESKILYYTGVEGLKRVTYNSTKAREVLRIIERVNDMSDFLPEDFSEEVRMKFVENRTHIHQLTTHKKIEPFTHISVFIRKYSHMRYLDPKKLNVSFEQIIYNDVYAMYRTDGEEIFCVEIYNPEMAMMQKQIFDFMWEHAQKMKFIDDRGSARVYAQ